jgi:acylphosphatase
VPVRVRVVVSGSVQAVFFRVATAERARELGVGGFVRNMPDGSVEAEFEGPPEAVEAAVAWCRSGPPTARVEHVAVEPREPAGQTEFRIR